MSRFARWIIVATATAVFFTGALLAQPAAPTPAQHAWSLSVNYALRETFDDNVFLQDVGSLAGRNSLVTSATLGLTAGYQKIPAFKAAFAYTPEIVRYHNYDSENYVAHRASINFGGAAGRTVWEFTNSLLRIDGSDQGPIFDVAHGEDIPALGGIPIRDRREAVVLRNGVKLTYTSGRVFVRPVFTSYSHDFRTEHLQRTGAYAGYENYIDRWEMSGGADAGYSLGHKTWLVAGYRYGHQEQGKLLGTASLYSNSYSRVLVGIEGSPAAWLRLNLSAGPDFRSFEKRPAGFDPDEQLWYINSSLSWLPSKKDTVTFTLSRYQQPAFSSHSVYEDIVYDVSWRHQHSSKLACTAGFRTYGGDWQAPVNREDWIYTPSASLSYAFHKRLAAEASYSYDTVQSRVPNTTGREYTRHMFVAAVRGTL